MCLRACVCIQTTLPLLLLFFIIPLGMTFSPNPCTKCRCDFDKTFGDHRYGNAVCSVTDCPTLKCTSGQSETKPGQCCPVCKTPTACPSLDTVEINLTESEKCKSHTLEPWSSKPILVCWKDQVQTATFILKGTSLKCEIKVKVIGKYKVRVRMVDKVKVRMVG